ncbi:MAG: type II toxin-antitoxin system prevent-host-death family antitoxin [Acidobacteria bacterium]|nr:type II toxin-antitoxin system prevent-host-death family antitoxin [Acidobacteriota bacterium]
MVYFYRRLAVVEQIAISQFKATCLSVLERVRKTRKPVLVTRFGVPVAEVVPPSAPERPAGWLGVLAGTGRIEGEIVAPTTEEEDWEVLRP